MDFDPKKNYYEILGLWEDANIDDVKKAFKKLAVKHHPDRWWDKKKFQEANEAYQVLSDERKKSQYDMYRKWWFSGFGWWEWWADFGNFWWFGGGAGGFDFGNVDIGDLFGSIFWWWFGAWGRGRVEKWWSDIQIAIQITFEESYLWAGKKISYSRMKKMQWMEERKCETCGGHGRVTQQVQTPFGVMQSQWACPKCWWIGKIYLKDGREIWAWWLEKIKDIVEIKIPAGIKAWAYIKFTDKWNDGIGWKTGDLYVQINVIPSRIYERKWNNIYVKIDVSLYDLVLWWECQVNHPEWKIKVRIPKWTQIWDMIKVSGKWFGEWWLFSKKWDMYLITKVEIPKKLSKEQERLWSELKGN